MNEEMKNYASYGNIEFEVDLENGNTVVISVGIDLLNNDRKYMPSLSLYKDRGQSDEKIIFVWDNDQYLYHTLYEEVVVPWVKDKSIINTKEFSEVISEGFHVNEFSKLKFIFDKAIEFGFFEELLNKTEKDGK
jgi:predicted MPP superfamily phosphohydrolase